MWQMDLFPFFFLFQINHQILVLDRFNSVSSRVWIKCFINTIFSRFPNWQAFLNIWILWSSLFLAIVCVLIDNLLFDICRRQAGRTYLLTWVQDFLFLLHILTLETVRSLSLDLLVATKDFVFPNCSYCLML